METVQERAQLLPEGEDNDSSGVNGGLGMECEVTEKFASTSIEEVAAETLLGEEEQHGPPATTTAATEAESGGGGRWRRLLHSCWALRRAWFMVEAIMLFKLAIPMVR